MNWEATHGNNGAGFHSATCEWHGQFSAPQPRRHTPSTATSFDGHSQFPSSAATNEHLELLRSQGFPSGLAKALLENSNSIAYRIWVVDNSSSMVLEDGHKVLEIDGKMATKTVTRWEELQHTVVYHAQMAAILKSFTRFRLLNHPGPSIGGQELVVGRPSMNVESEINHVRRIISKVRPDGVTPLTKHICDLREQVQEILPKLHQFRKKVAVVIATDGLPTDGQGYGGDDIMTDFITALKTFEGLPVWIVIRLCTDESNITGFYNQLDALLDNLDVLDDYMSESKEVNCKNPWLNYALPLHRCRELGYHDSLFDLLDERLLTKVELRHFCGLLFGSKLDNIPDPVSEWVGFMEYVKSSLARESPQWNPHARKMKPWISVKKLNRMYNQSACKIS